MDDWQSNQIREERDADTAIEESELADRIELEEDTQVKAAITNEHRYRISEKRIASIWLQVKGRVFVGKDGNSDQCCFGIYENRIRPEHNAYVS